MTPEFERTLAALNDAQREAVDGIHGPWMVLAGPGTGKTHMLAARIGNILLREQVEPRNILCLTFTNAGVKAMRDRLVRFIGAPGARVAVHTFHDFARRVIDENPALFEYTEWREMDDLDARRLVNRLIDELAPDHPMRGPQYEPYRFGKDLLWLFGQMAQESWSVEDVVAAANHHVLDLPNIKEYVYQRKYKDKAPGDLKPNAAKQEEKMELLKAGCRLRARYQTLKRERGLYDYADQVGWLRDALATHETLRLQLQEQYQYLLVDEYQDTNGLQNEIIALLAEDVNPNLFVVGDDDQSIYGFQGARIEGLRELAMRYIDDLRFVVLRENYRSHARILAAAEHLIGLNATRLLEIGGQAFDKDLAEAAPFTARPAPQVIRYPNAWAQAFYVAKQIDAWVAEGVPPGEIGVIYRKHAQAERLVESLEERGVPYRLERSINVLEVPLVRRLHAALSFIGNLRDDRPVDNALAWEFMLCPAIGLEPTDLYALNDFRFGQSRRVDAWKYLLRHPEVLERDEVPVVAPERFRRAADLMNALGVLGDRYPLTVVIRQVAQQTGLLREALAGPEHDLALEAVDALIRDASARLAKQPGLTLGELCGTWDEMNAYDMPLRLVKQADTRPAVSLMTAHSAKGLEFDRVILYDVTKRAWDSTRKFQNTFALPPELSHELSAEAKEEENRRLLYVALTRAKRHLHLTVPEESDRGTAAAHSLAVDALLTEYLAEERDAEVDDDELHAGLATHHAQALPSALKPLAPRVAQQLWEDADLTLGAARQFARCKTGFYYQYVRDVSAARRPLDRFRAALHETLREFYRNALHPEHLAFGAEEELVAAFAHQLNRERTGIGERDFARFADEGEEMLRAWHRSPADPPSLHTLIERTIATTTAAGLRLRGRIDRIDVDPQTTLGTPVDYKFGKAKPLDFGVTRATGRPKYRDDYRWQQLAFYALLMRDAVNHGALPRSGKLVYLSAKGTEVVEVELKRDDLLDYEEELHRTFVDIQECDDYAGCHEDPATPDRDKMNCAWCAFHYLERDDAVLVSEEVVALDDG